MQSRQTNPSANPQYAFANRPYTSLSPTLMQLSMQDDPYAVMSPTSPQQQLSPLSPSHYMHMHSVATQADGQPYYYASQSPAQTNQTLQLPQPFAPDHYNLPYEDPSQVAEELINSPYFKDLDDFPSTVSGLANFGDTGIVNDSPRSEFLETPRSVSGDIVSIHIENDSGLLAHTYSHDSEWHQRPAVASPYKSPAGLGLNISPTKIEAQESLLYTMSPDPSHSPLPPTSTSPSVSPYISPSELDGAPKSSGNNSNARVTRSRGKSLNANGTRKGVTPDSLIPLDAPTQKRNYSSPSSTSRKPVPLRYQRHARDDFGDQDIFDDADDDDEMEALPPTASKAQVIAYHRRRNTLAARKSRRRKLEYLGTLEKTVSILRADRKVWETRARTIADIARSHGLPLDTTEWDDTSA